MQYIHASTCIQRGYDDDYGCRINCESSQNGAGRNSVCLSGGGGGQAIDLFNALYGENDIDVILQRHEQGLVHAADGYARSTGKVGVCLVTSGPGATNLVTGIATANYDSVPMVCFTGQVPTGLIGNDAFQEVDLVGITRSICKYAVTVRKRDELAAVIKKLLLLPEQGNRVLLW